MSGVVWPRIISLVWILAVLPAYFVAMMGAFLFDAPGSTDSPLTWLAFFGLVALPFACLVAGVGGIIYSFVMRDRGKTWLTKGFASLPLMNVAYILAVFLLINVFCQGRFACSD